MGTINHGLDRSTTLVTRDGREKLLTVDEKIEETRLAILAESHFADPAQQARFKGFMDELAGRPLRDAGMNTDEVARTYHEVSRLIEAPNASVMDKATRLKLSEQVMNLSAHPTLIEQGSAVNRP